MTTGHELTTLITGGFARQPGNAVQQCLPSGCSLQIVPQPDNPYDPHALAVTVDPQEIPPGQYQELKDRLEGTGWELQDVLQGEAVQIGWVAATDGKPLARAGGGPGNREFAQAAQQLGLPVEGPWSARLSFSPSGLPLVSLALRAEDFK